MNDVVHYDDLRFSIRKLNPTWGRKLAPIICLPVRLLRMAEWWIMPPSGPDSGLNGTTSNRGTQRNRMEPHRTPRIAKNGQLRAQIHLFSARFPHFRIIVSFSPLPFSQHLLLRQMEGLSKLPTCLVLVDRAGWGKRPAMAERRRKRTGQRGDWRKGQPRNPTEPHGSPRNT